MSKAAAQLPARAAGQRMAPEGQGVDVRYDDPPNYAETPLTAGNVAKLDRLPADGTGFRDVAVKRNGNRFSRRMRPPSPDDAQPLLNTGLRFSTNARAASLWSGSVMLISSKAREASSTRLTDSLSTLLTETLLQRMAQRGPSASSRANSLAFFITSPAGTA